VTTTGTWRKGDRLTARWVQRVSNFIENFTVSGGAFEFDGRTPRLYVSAGSGAHAAAPFSYTISNGVPAVSHGSVRVNTGMLVYHLPDDLSGADRYFVASDTTADCTIDTANYSIVYASWTIASTTYTGGSSGLVVSTTAINDTSELGALQDLNSTSTVLKFPILCVSYNTTTRVVTFVREYNANKIYSVVPVAGIGP